MAKKIILEMRQHKLRVLVAGGMPPPYGGQTINTRRVFEVLASQVELEVIHWKFSFSQRLDEFRRPSFHKVIELASVIGRLLKIRLTAGPIDYILYSTGGPHRAPILRDIVLLPLACLFSRRVVVHFQAAGIAGMMPKIGWGLRFAIRLVHRGCWCAVSLTEYGRADPESLGIKNIKVISNAIEDRNLGGLIPSCSATEGVIRILNVGHLCADKGTPELLRAFATIASEGTKVKLCLVGECLAPYTNELLDAEIENLGIGSKVEKLGLLTGKELDDAYRNSSLFVFPSVAPYESFGLVLIEAMMWGLPLVVSDWRGNSEVVTSGLGGIIYLPGNRHSEPLSRALDQAITSRAVWPAWGETNRKIYLEKYSIARMRAELVELIQ